MKKNVVREGYYSGAGTFARPDTSGIRGKGVGNKAQQSGGDDFPYDDERGAWGEPSSYSRDSSGHGGSRRPVPVPKHVASDDDRWKEDIEEHDGYMDGNSPAGNIVNDPGRERSKFGLDDEKDEAVGVPFNSARAGQGTGGQHTGGRVMPGTSGQWSSRPSGGHWDSKVDDEDLEEYSYGMPFMGDVSRKRSPSTRDDDSVGVKKNKGFKSGMGGAMKNSRMSPGMTWKESDDALKDREDSLNRSVEFNKGGKRPPLRTTDRIKLDKGRARGKLRMTTPRARDAERKYRGYPEDHWESRRHRALVEAFVSYKDVPDQKKDDGDSIQDVDMDFVRDTFAKASSAGKKHLHGHDDHDVVKILMKMDPDSFAKSFAKIGKDGLSDIYDQWVTEKLEGDRDSIEKTADRIMMVVGMTGKKKDETDDR